MRSGYEDSRHTVFSFLLFSATFVLLSIFVVPVSGIAWHTETVDSTGGTGDTGWYLSLALNSSGYPGISYHYESPGQDLKYAVWNGSAWNNQTVDSVSAHTGRWTSLVFDRLGQPADQLP